MRLKSELYAKEQEEIVNKMVTILDLENKKIYTLFELDNNKEIQSKIMALIPEIRKYYSFNGMKAVGEPERIKRPWLSITKQLLKSIYNIECKLIRIGDIRTQEYRFNLILKN
uniref:Uncharacterized protein n=1 Tax=viral metagenome TaxID=1070528 RepID=A0A6C0HS49_9ZZZZ